MKKTLLMLSLIFITQNTLAQAVYGVFTPTPNAGEKQIGTVDPGTGDISLLGTGPVETGSLAMTTGATALNVTDNYSYFIGRDSLNVSRIYTVDLTSGNNIVGSPQALTAGYTTDNNFGIWFDDVDDVVYAIFSIAGAAELASIDPSTGTVTQVMADVTNGEGINNIASGLLTGDQDNDRIFAFINDSIWTIYPDIPESYFTEVGNANFLSSHTFGLEWDGVSNALWLLYNPDLGDRKIAKITSEEWFDEAFSELDITLDGGANIATASGLSAVDEDSGLYFFIGRPSIGANANKWSLYTVDLNNETNTSVDIEDTGVVATNNYAGIEVLPGPDMTFTKSDGDVTDTEPGDTITYTLSYSNDANAGATDGLTITETVPAETTFLPGSSTPDWDCSPDSTAGSTCEISPAEVAPGGSGNVTFVVQVNAMVTASLTQIDNSATLSANNIINASVASDSTPITATAVLAVTKTDNDVTDTEPGDVIAYDITADNNGNREASNAVLTETVPANTTYIPTAPFVWTCVPDNSSGSSCTTLNATLDQSQYTTTFHVQVIASVPANTTEISNTVTLSADNATSTQAADATPIISAAVLNVSKTDNDATFIPGETVVYQIDYSNTGNQDADSTTLSEVILPETVFSAANSTFGWDCPLGITEGNTCTFDLATLGGGVGGSVDFALTMNTPVLGIFSQVTNTVEMDASNATLVSAQDTTPVNASVVLRVVKSDGGVTAALGKVINYTLISFNDGDRNAINALLTETVPDNTTFYSPSSSPGWSCSPDNSAGSTCTYDIGSLTGLSGKTDTFFAVKVDSTLEPSVTELTNTATLSAFNSLDSDQDTVITPVDKVIPTVTLIDANPSITELASCSQNDATISEVVISFLDDNPDLIGVNNVMNYALVDTGINQDLETMSCEMALGDDVMVGISGFATGGTSTAPSANLTLTDPIGDGQYVLMICDGITDAAGNAIDGDADGIPGGNLLRQFRIDTDNLFANAYLDDCNDNPIDIAPWLTVNNVGDMVSVLTAVDRDDSDLSGSILLDSVSGNGVAIEQCVNFPAVKSHAVSTAILGIPSQSDEVTMTLNCDFSDQLNCGNVTSNHIETFTLSPSVAPQWTHQESIMLLPNNTLSASCLLSLNSSTNEPFTFFMDALKVRDSDLIFKNGFESD